MMKQRGVTLIELIMFIVLVSVGMASLLSLMGYFNKTSADPIIQKQALLVAESMLDEVLSKSFDDLPNDLPENPMVRSEFNDVDDYHNFVMNPIAARDGSPISGLEAYRLTVTVDKTTATLGNISSPLVKKITVEVVNGTEIVSLVGYRVDYD